MGCNVFVEAGLCLLQETLTGSCTYTPFLLFPYNQLSRFYKPPASLPDLPTFFLLHQSFLFLYTQGLDKFCLTWCTWYEGHPLAPAPTAVVSILENLDSAVLGLCTALCQAPVEVLKDRAWPALPQTY